MNFNSDLQTVSIIVILSFQYLLMRCLVGMPHLTLLILSYQEEHLEVGIMAGGHTKISQTLDHHLFIRTHMILTGILVEILYEYEMFLFLTSLIKIF